MPDLLLPLPSAQAETTPACLVLVDVVGSTRLAHTLPLAHYMALMTEFVQVMILSFEARGGQVLQHQGDAVLCYWPESDLPQACAAALDAHERASRIGLAGLLGVQLQLRAGIAAGEVITGMVGGQLSAYGLPVNYAKRLCDSAQPGETFACPRVGEAAAAFMPVLDHPLLDLEGFGTACRAYRLSQPPLRTAALVSHMKVD